MSPIWIFLLVVMTVACLTLWIRNYINGETLLRDWRHNGRVRKADLVSLDRACAARTDRTDVVVSLSTVPSRLPYIASTLKSLLLQNRLPREIRLNIPDFSRRESCAYDVPQWLRDLKMVRIVACEDYGPATKFLPTLLDEKPDQIVIAVDDDRIYPPTLVGDLEAAARKNPNAAFGTCGWIVPKDMIDRVTNFSTLNAGPPAPIMGISILRKRAVDVLKGVSGYAIRPRFFDLEKLSNYEGAPDAAFFVDDIWMSGLCQVPKFVIPTGRMDFHPKDQAMFYRSTSLGQLDPNKERNTIMLQYFGADIWHVGGPRNL